MLCGVVWKNAFGVGVDNRVVLSDLCFRQQRMLCFIRCFLDVMYIQRFCL